MGRNRYDNKLTYFIYSFIFGYDEKKYWRLRQRIVDPCDRAGKFRKYLWLISLKRMEAKNSASLGTAIDKGAKFGTPPILPHGLTGIFISHGAVIGKNCLILQNVTIGSSKGNAPVIGDDVVIGAGATIVGGGNNW